VPGFLATALLLLSIALLDGALGPRGAQLRPLLSLVALLPVFVQIASGVDPGGRRRLAAAIGGAACVVVWYVSAGASPFFALSFFSLAAAFLLFAVGLREEDGRRGLALALGLTAFCYGSFVAVRDYATLWPVLYPLSTRASSAIGLGLGVVARYGPSHSGMWLLFAFAAAFISRVAVGQRASAWKALLGVVLLIVAPVFWLGVRYLGQAAMWAGINPQLLSGRAIQFAFLLVPLALFVRGYPLTSGSPSAGRSGGGVTVGRRAAAVSGALVIVGLVLLAWPVHVSSTTGRVLLDSRGEFSLEPLRWGAYARDAGQGASIATLPPYLEALGFEVTVHDTVVDPSVLLEHDVMVVMNPAYAFEDPELDAIWSFVERGGGLLVLGDHTNIAGTMGPLNALLEPSGVRVEFDSAIPQIMRWTWYGCMRFHPHPLTAGIRDETDVKTSVGASLALPLHAIPILTGRDAYSDAGNWNNDQGAYLGNMRYDVFETFGDLPLAAVVHHGAGKAVVFGDTSPFQRSAIFNSHEFVARVFTYLATPGTRGASGTVRVVGAVLVALGALGLLLAAQSSTRTLAATAVIAVVVLWITSGVARVEPPAITGDTDVGIIDLSHGNRVDLHSGEDNGIAGLADQFWRGGYVPLGAKDFDEELLESAEIFATVAPSVPFTRGERRRLVEFVEQGGLLIVGTGYEESAGAEGLLAEFGYSIGSTPIGAAHRAISHIVGQFAIMHESWPVVRPDGRGEVWMSSWDYPLIVYEEVGEGAILVIGDSFFLCDVMLEGREQFVEQNINLMRMVLEMTTERAAGPAAAAAGERS
jgi:hypothetical protein